MKATAKFDGHGIKFSGSRTRTDANGFFGFGKIRSGWPRPADKATLTVDAFGDAEYGRSEAVLTWP